MKQTRTLDDLGYEVSADVLHAIDLLRNRYGATSHRDSGHQLGKGGRPTWIFEMPHFEAEVGVPMNRRDLTLYMRNRTRDGKRLSDLLPADKVVKVYPRDGRPARSIKDSRFLGTASGGETVMLSLKRDDLEPLFEAFFAMPPENRAPSPEDFAGSAPEGSADRQRIALDAEAFEALLERRSEIGQSGERIAMRDELARLGRMGCVDPHRWVERVALVDVGRDYDIASTWPGHERYIEVKSSTSLNGRLFISINERRALEGLGTKGWLYHVIVNGDGDGEVTTRLQDPIRALPPEVFEPVVFQIGLAEHASASKP